MADSIAVLKPATFIFEVWDSSGKGPVEALPGFAGGGRIALRLGPQSVQTMRPHRAEVTLDLGGVVSVSDGGPGLARWNMSGRHGVWGPRSWDKPVVIDESSTDPVLTDGFRARQNLLDFFTAWAKENRRLASTGDPLLRMVFTIINPGPSDWRTASWFIQPETWPGDERDTSKPTDWGWSISFVELGTAERKPKEKAAPDTVSGVSLSQLQAEAKAKAAEVTARAKRLQSLTDAAKSLKTTLSSVRARLDGIRTSVFGSPELNAIRAIQSTLRSETLGILAVAKGFGTDATAFVRSVAQDIRAFQQEANPAAIRSEFDRLLLGTVYDTKRALGAIRFAVTQADTLWRPSSARPPLLPVLPGDTVQAVAQRAIGDSREWMQIVRANKLDYPYFDFSGPGGAASADYAAAGLRVFGSGDSVKLPGADGAAVGMDPLGRDLDPDGAPGTLIGGIENLRRALLRRLQTPVGYLPHHADYGSALPSYIGQPLTPSLVGSVRAEVARTLMADPRVQAVPEIRVQVDLDAVFVDASATTVFGDVQVSGIVRRL